MPDRRAHQNGIGDGPGKIESFPAMEVRHRQDGGG
jgi:hypothetical protein